MGWPAAKYWVACGQKSGKIYLENLREYFRIVFAVSALFSQYNRFLDCEKTRKGDSYIICLMGTNDFVDLSGEGGNDVFGDIPHDIVVNSHIVVY